VLDQRAKQITGTAFLQPCYACRFTARQFAPLQSLLKELKRFGLQLASGDTRPRFYLEIAALRSYSSWSASPRSISRGVALWPSIRFE